MYKSVITAAQYGGTACPANVNGVETVFEIACNTIVYKNTMALSFAPSYLCLCISRYIKIICTSHVSHYLHQACAINCLVSGFSDTYGSCDKTCGTGAKYRVRSVITPANGGNACPTLQGNSAGCNTFLVRENDT
jgi:hypothetical protein